MAEAMERCENCLQMFPESKIPTHFGYCRRNIKKCGKCGEMYDINFMQEHEEEFHKTSQCSYCKLTLPANDLPAHASRCPQKPKFCEYCQLQVPVTEFSAHLKACQSRTKECQKCRKPVSNKDFLIHLTTCKGIVEEPVPSKTYEQYIEEKRKDHRREEEKKEVRAKVYDRREYEYRPKEEPRQPESKRELKYQYKYQYKPVEKKDYKPSDRKETYKISSKDTKLSNPISQHQIHSKPVTYVKSNKEIETKPRKQIFQHRQPPPATYSREQPVTTYTREHKPTSIKQQPIPTHKREHVPTYAKQQPKIYTKEPTTYAREKPVEHHVEQGRAVRQPERKAEKKEEERRGNGENNQPVSYGMEEDEELQRAILESMGQKVEHKRVSAEEFGGVDVMNESFYKDVDVGKQMALMQEFERRQRR